MNWCPLSESNREITASKAADFANLSKRALLLLRKLRLPIAPQALKNQDRSRNRKLVWAVGFEPTTSRFQGEDSDRTELRPEMVGRG